MTHYDRAEKSVTDILRVFSDPMSLPESEPFHFIRRADDSPCRSWPWECQVAIAVQGHADARTAGQWNQVGRWIQAGEPALEGVKGPPVYGLSQTEGEPLTTRDSTIEKWRESLPLLEVAHSWGLSVEAFNGCSAAPRGVFLPNAGIALGLSNLLPWAHELVHAAEDQLDANRGESWQGEVVASLGGAALLIALGLDSDADLGGCWKHIERQVTINDLHVVESCKMLLARTHEAVSTILTTAEEALV